MIRTFFVKNKNEYKPGKVISVFSSMSNKKATEKYKIVKLLHFDKQDSIGEFKVQPIDVSKDAGNLLDKNGKYKKSIR